MSKKSCLGSPVYVGSGYSPEQRLDGNEANLKCPQLLSQVSKAKDGNGKYNETMLQDLLHRCPGALPVGDFYPSVTSLISLGREVPVDIGSGTGSIDNLFVTDDAHLVLVETKLSRNPEATREVVAQTLQYGMAISRLSLDQFEACLRRATSKSDRLGAGETLVQRINKVAPEGFQIDLANGFEEAFNSSRRAGEILLLIVTDGIHSSAERLVQWMNEVVGSAPYKFGLVELGIYDLPDGGRVVIPKTRLRITEASRHVVTVLTQVAGPDLSYTVTEADEAPRKGVAASPPAITDEALIQKIRAGNPPEVYALVEKLRVLLNSISPRTRATPTEIQYGVDVKEDFIEMVRDAAMANS